MHQKIATKDLKAGMFIADLDRPWIDTPFLLQGFLIEDDEQMAQLRQHCQWVMIDPARSVGKGFDTPAKKTAFTPRDVGTEPRVTAGSLQRPAPINRKPAPAAAPPGRTPLPGTAKGTSGSRDFAVSMKDSRNGKARTSHGQLAPPAARQSPPRPD